MSTAAQQTGLTEQDILQEVIGYLNFSNGASDPKFLGNVNAVWRTIEARSEGRGGPVPEFCCRICRRMDQLQSQSPTFGDVAQARAIVRLLQDHLLPGYREFHRDLLWHQSDDQLWRPLFIGRALETLVSQGGPWNETERIVAGALDQLNDYLGYRPVAMLESEQQMEPYAHEWVRPIPLYIRDVGVGCGPYETLIQQTLEILGRTDEEILQQAWFDLGRLDELALDPRAYDFDHPAGNRPNYHFGQWDPQRVDNRGYYRRFVLQQITLNSLLSRVEALSDCAHERNNLAAKTRDELWFEAAAVLAGTILMASGTSGYGPGCHSSDVTLGTLMPHIAAYRDQFYEQLISHASEPHRRRLLVEAERIRQPFGGARQHLNHELSRRRALQLQQVHLTQLYARMSYPEAALEQAHSVRIASARMLCQIYCRLTAGHQAIDTRHLDCVARQLAEIEELLERGIECGALVDPWNVVGFGGNFSLFPALENSVHDFRVDDLIELVEQILDLCARAWTEAAAIDDAHHEQVFSTTLSRLAGWWDKYATSSIGGVKRLVAKEVEVSTNLVAGALSAWHKAGAAAGDVKFWRMFVDQFDSPKAFQLVLEALLDRGDQVASMALMMQWISQVERTPLESGDATFHPLALRWLRSVEEDQRTTGTNQWPLVAKFFAHLEASADTYWHVPQFDIATPSAEQASSDDDLPSDDMAENDGLESDDPNDFWTESEDDELFSAAYEGMIYRDSTDDGFDFNLLEEGGDGSEFELEQEGGRLANRLELLMTVGRLWKHAAVAWEPAQDQDRRELLATWHEQAASWHAGLLELVETVHRYPIRQSTGSHAANVEFDRRRMMKDSLLEQIISTCVEVAGAGRLLCAASGKSPCSADHGELGPEVAESIDVLRGVLSGDAAAVRRAWPAFTESLATHELLYVPLAKGGRPRRIVRARALGRLIHDLLGWLPRLGLVRETCQLLSVAQSMETEHPVGPGAMTEYDRLFTTGYQAVVRCLVTSADEWDRCREPKERSIGRVRPSDMMLVESLQDFTESQLPRWLRHSRTLRLSVVERLADETEWNDFVAFVQRYGADLFTQTFMNLSNLRSILHQRAGVWLSNLQQAQDAEPLRLVEELGREISVEDASRWLTLAIEAVVENFREYLDYNATTTHSDHGEMLYMLVDFLRLRAAYDRVAWNLKLVVIAHEILVRQGRPAAAELWQQALSERTTEAADEHQARFERLSEQYGMRLASVAERLSERFIRPLAIDRVRALVRPAMEAAGSADQSAFAALQWEIDSLVREPPGAGLNLPDWLEALEEEVSLLRVAERHREPSDDMLRRIDQVRLGWDELQEQLGEDAELDEAN